MAKWPACCSAGGSRRSSCRDRWSTGRDGQRGEPGECRSEVEGPGPGALNAQPASALSAGEPCGDVQQPVAQRRGLGLREVAVLHHAMLLTHAHTRLLLPGLAQLTDPDPPAPSPLRTAARHYRQAIDQLIQEA